MAAVLVVYGAIVATHQLTPYMVVAQVFALTLLGLRPRWLVGALVAVAIGYLLPNFSFLVKHYGLLASLNPLSNLQLTTGSPADPPWFASHAGKFLTGLLLLLAAIGAVRLVRQGSGRRVLTLVALAMAPFCFLFGSNYGGEGILRVILFSSPWLAVLSAWGLVPAEPRPRLVAGLALVAVTLVALFAFAFAGFAAGNVIPRDEVQASQYYYAHAPRGSVMVIAGEDFPVNLAANYDAFAGTIGDSSPTLTQDKRLAGRRLSARDIPEVISFIAGQSPTGYLVFSTTDYLHAAFYKDFPRGSLRAFESAVAKSPNFRLWYRNRDARIYRLVVPAESLR